MEIKFGIHNRFDIVITNVETGEKRKYETENIILDSFWAKFISANSSGYADYIHFGSGVTKVVTDTTLTTKIDALPVSSVKTLDMEKAVSENILAFVRTVRLEAGAYAGASISEVGLGPDTSNVVTKALIQDSNGNPITIPVGLLDVVDIYSTFFFDRNTNIDSVSLGKFQGFKVGFNSGVYFALLDAFIINPRIPGVDNNGVSWGAGWRLNLDNKPFYLLKGRPFKHYSGYSIADSFGFTTSPTVTYDIPNKKITFSFPAIQTSQGNNERGYRGMVLFGNLLIDLPNNDFNQPVITKEVVATADGIKKDFSTKFGFIKNNGTAKAYVNDLEVSATFDYNRPNYQNVASALEIISETPNVSNGITSYDVEYRIPEQNGNNTGTITTTYENPFYSTNDVISINGSGMLQCSNNLTDWTTVSFGDISPAYKNYRYWKHTTTASNQKITAFNLDPAILDNIHLANAPPAGSTISVTYQPDVIAKDAEHILQNITVWISFSEGLVP